MECVIHKDLNIELGDIRSILELGTEAYNLMLFKGVFTSSQIMQGSAHTGRQWLNRPVPFKIRPVLF